MKLNLDKKTLKMVGIISAGVAAVSALIAGVVCFCKRDMNNIDIRDTDDDYYEAEFDRGFDA